MFLNGLPGYFYCLALFGSSDNKQLSKLAKMLAIGFKQLSSNAFLFNSFIQLNSGLNVHQAKATAEEEKSYLTPECSEPHDKFFQALMMYWLDESALLKQRQPDYEQQLNSLCRTAEKNGYRWYAAVSAQLLSRLKATDQDTRKIAERYQDSEFIGIIDLIPRLERWERALNALHNLVPDTGKVDQVVEKSDLRMIWTLEVGANQAYLAPREQKIGKNGRWTKGKPVALKRLHEEKAEFEYLSEQDRKICQCIGVNHEYRGYWGKETYALSDRAITEAIGHPHIYWMDAQRYDAPISVIRGEIQLLVSEQKKQIHIALSHTPDFQYASFVERTADDQVIVYPVNEQHHQIAEVLGETGLTAPKAAKQQVIDSLSSIASMLTVQSDIGGLATSAESVESDQRLHIHLQPSGDGLQIDVYIQPFSGGGPIYRVGVGGVNVFAEIDGKALQTTRDLALEKQRLKQLMEACSELYPGTEGKWIFEEAETALEALLQLQELDETVVLEWPKGKAIKISRETGIGNVQFSVRKEKDWFSVSGEVAIDDGQVMDMQSLMSILAASPGRFLQLEEGQVVALSRELRQRLDDISALGDGHGKKLNFHPLAAQVLDDLSDGMSVKAGKHWRDQVERLSEAADLEPVLPSTFQGELRDYQLVGYQWLSRLAHLGAGACLADDMGLGKTIQALALILSRAPDGPTLILAPTSVCNNWLEEGQRFAPTLNVQYLGAGNREVMLEQADSFDVIVCSYGLLHTEAEKLTAKSWRTIIADEAQAIKNALTKRSKAAMALQGDFKVITTGTPIENHLGELWNLFNFVNPGLLGSLKKFNERYASKIENQQDYATRQRLKRLLQPFILRRLKTDVLTELPARTEVTLHVELSEEERVFYEALRRNAMAVMERSQEQGEQAGQQHLQVLAEITKLRRACCHPRLIMQESAIASSKLQAFEELVDELISNHHKALVFSQFVSHLSLLRELLDSKGVSYQYLDGSTGMKQRQQAVKAFQSGEGDLFLISLKAGGSGLNLTAADYVVHMDPWWNPAVEDQASDRAHRMGQKRPVTIYRLVAKDTIEDKIVDLHRHKRDLADSLLEGGDVGGKLSVDDMLALIQEME